jgi:ribosomal protein L34
MTEPPRLPESDEADLAALADGRLDPARRTELEARLAADPQLAEAFARQRHGLSAITAAVESTSAPLALRTRVEAIQRERARPRRRALLPPLGRWMPAAGLAAAAAAAALLIVALVGGGPNVQEVLAAAIRPPVAAVSIDPSLPKLLEQDEDGVRFPNYGPKFGWTATGTRTDEIDGRATRTVFYRYDGREVAYTIVGGDALAWPEHARRSQREGVELRSFTEAGREVVTWRRQGRTCVLSGRGVDVDALLALAAWKGQGDVKF